MDAVQEEEAVGKGKIVLHALGCVRKSRLHDRYKVLAIMTHHIFVLSQNASAPWRKVIAFYSYCSRLMEIVIAS